MKILKKINNYFFDVDYPSYSDALYFYGLIVGSPLLAIIVILGDLK